MRQNFFLKSVIIFVSIFFFLFHVNVTFATEDPIKMLQTITQRIIVKLKKSKREFEYKDRMDGIYRFIKIQVLPHLDFVEMGRWVVGRYAWRKANTATRQAFISEFKVFMVKNYTAFFLKWTNEEIEFFPLRDGIKNKKDIQISSLIKKPGRSPIQMDYQLILLEDGWKIYDILIEGTSVLEGYQAQFSREAKKGGLTAVIEKMRQLNAK